MDGTFPNSPDRLGDQLRATPARARFDTSQAALRSGEQPLSIRRDPPPRPPELDPTADVLMLRSGEELEYARRMLDQIGDSLAADMTVVMRHPIALQSIGIVGQMLGHIASVVGASDSEAAVDRIGLCELKSRLTRISL